MTLISRAVVVALGALAVRRRRRRPLIPERPITLIVPWAAGGGTDATARIIGTLLEKELGQPVNVVNRDRRQRRRRPQRDRAGARPTATRSASSPSRSA